MRLALSVAELGKWVNVFGGGGVVTSALAFSLAELVWTRQAGSVSRRALMRSAARRLGGSVAWRAAVVSSLPHCPSGMGLRRL